MTWLSRFWQSLLKGVDKNDSTWYVLQLSRAIVSLGSLLFFIVLVLTYFSGGVYNKELCFSNQCFLNLYESMSASFEVLKFFGGVSLGFFALASFGVACKNYVTNKTAHETASHISYLSIFISYVSSEISKKYRVNKKSIDTIAWYNCAFPDSSKGVYEVSENYLSILIEIMGCVSVSNENYESVSDAQFDYNEHQTRMKAVLFKLGIHIERMPRSDFFQAEKEVLSFISSVNQSFFRMADPVVTSETRAYA
ncbi:retron Ec48 family effector membrane protein [Salinicola aestuarinus]|uniref:retron Ec48 family effector membrane protein n=1 Tax=Salinicola aestuarinus TaxID=1949082 RepID=UPI00130033F6|nr:retron Ec48 family effector membrane protein [Salinicola aestuarinus]